MKNAILINTNAYDGILLPNGTWIEVDEKVMYDFINAEKENDDFSNWDGPNRWDDYAETLENAINDGMQVISYYEDGKMVIVDNAKWEELQETYKCHWLDIICLENETTIYKIAKNADCDKSVLYRVISNNADFENISLSTMNAIAKGLNMTAYEFVKKYFNRFMD